MLRGERFQMVRITMRPSLMKILSCGLAILLSVFAGCQSRDREVLKRTQFVMGTLVEITLVAENNKASAEALRGAFQEMRRVEALMSRRIEGSDVSRVNEYAGKKVMAVSNDLISVIKVALETSHLSDGRFDVTVGSLVRLWEKCWKENRVPSQEEVVGALQLVDYHDLEVDGEKNTLFLRREGMQLVLGGIAKGYAVDQAYRFLRDRGFTDLIVNAGGDLRAAGSKLGLPWVVGIQNPRDKTKMVGTLEVTDAAVATSGDYERYYMKDGVRYHHILDPLTGFPARGCRGVTVLGDELMRTDALATAVFVLGPEKGLALVEKLPQTEALIIDEKGRTLLSSGMEDRIGLD